MEKTFHILTDTPIILTINNNWFNIDNNKNFSLQESITYNFMIFFNNNEFSPFAFSMDKDFNSNSNQVEVFKISSDSVFIKITPIVSANSLLLEDGNHKVYNGYAIYYNHTKLANGRFYATNCKKIFDNGKKVFILENNTTNLVIGVNENKVIFTEKADIIEIERDKLSLLFNTHDNFSHGIVKVYSLENFNLLENYSVYMSSPKKLSVNFTNLCPLFISAGKGLNQKLCLSFLDSELKSNFSIKKFIDFFGDIEYFYEYSVSPTECKILIKSNQIKSYTFKLRDNKIVDID